MNKYLWYTVRESLGSFDIHGFKTQAGGVLDGQTIKCYISTFETLEAAMREFPDAKPGSRWTDPQTSMRHLPGENDPVAGGMYLDDI